jgi:hypothetical protein
VRVRIGPPAARRMRVRLTLDADPGQRHPCWPQSLLRACTRISHAGLVLTPMPIVDDPTIPRVGECERKAAFVPSCQAPGRVTRSLRMDPSEARANTSPPGPKTGDLSNRYVEPGHSAISRCDRSKTSVGAPGCGPQPDTYVLPAACGRERDDESPRKTAPHVASGCVAG